MRITMSMAGQQQVIANLNRYDTKTQDSVQKVIDLTAQLVRTDAIKSMKSSPATGRVYRRGNITHRASSPGSPPRVDTGRLINSVKALVKRLEAIVGTDVRYGAYLEFGTQDIEPRPWLFPAFERQRRNFINRLKQATSIK